MSTTCSHMQAMVKLIKEVLKMTIMMTLCNTTFQKDFNFSFRCMLSNFIGFSHKYKEMIAFKLVKLTIRQMCPKCHEKPTALFMVPTWGRLSV